MTLEPRAGAKATRKLRRAGSGGQRAAPYAVLEEHRFYAQGLKTEEEMGKLIPKQ